MFGGMSGAWASGVSMTRRSSLGGGAVSHHGVMGWSVEWWGGLRRDGVRSFLLAGVLGLGEFLLGERGESRQLWEAGLSLGADLLAGEHGHGAWE